MRYTHNLVGHNSMITFREGCSAGGWNIELIAVIGKQASHVDKKDAYKYIGGYTIMIDQSGHDDKSPFYGDGAWKMEEEDMEIMDHFYRTKL